MKVERDFYLQFYPVLHARFLRKAYTADMAKKYEGGLSFDVWDAYDPDEEKRKIAVFFAGVNGKCGVKYFYRRYRDFERYPLKRDCDIERLILFKALVFIGVDRGKKLDNGLILDFDTLLSSKEWHKANSPKLIDELKNLFEQNPTKYLEDQPFDKSLLPTLSTVSSNAISLLDEEVREYSNIVISPEEKDFLYEFFFNVAKPFSKRSKVLEIFFAHSSLLSDEEVSNMISNCPNDMLMQLSFHIGSLLANRKMPHKLFGEAIDVSVVNGREDVVKMLMFNVFYVCPRDGFGWLNFLSIIISNYKSKLGHHINYIKSYQFLGIQISITLRNYQGWVSTDSLLENSGNETETFSPQNNWYILLLYVVETITDDDAFTVFVHTLHCMRSIHKKFYDILIEHSMRFKSAEESNRRYLSSIIELISHAPYLPDGVKYGLLDGQLVYRIS